MENTANSEEWQRKDDKQMDKIQERLLSRW